MGALFAGNVEGTSVVEYPGERCGMLRKLWSNDQGQSVAEYAVMLAVILVLVVGTVRLIGGSANNTFSTVASAVQ